MPLKKLTLKAGVNKENTRYTNENGWYVADKVRFRQGTPEKIGGWQRLSANTFLGICRSLWNWVTLQNFNLIGVGTNLKFYIEKGGVYNDITPIRSSSTINNNPFSTTNASAVVTVTDTAHGGTTNDFVTFSGATTVGGLDLNNEYQITVLTANTYTITAASAASSTATGGGASVVAAYQINTGPAIEVALTGWGAGAWGAGPWGVGTPSATETSIRIWSQQNFGEDLIFAPAGGQLYYWDATSGVTSRGVLVSSLSGASDVPTVQNFIFVSDTSRFVFAFGTNEPGSATQDPMLVRWSDQESVVNWTPAITNQANSIRLSHGSRIVTCVQARQEIVVFTDSSVYSFQYQGPPAIWASQLLGDNISIASSNAAIIASGVVYWMGVDKFYKYDGRTQTLRCDLRQYIFQDINLSQAAQIFSGTNEGFNEVWWFYCSANSTVIDRYVTFNYFENNGEGVWSYGTLGRTAWLDSGLRDYPLGATYSYNLVNHEFGNDDGELEDPVAINAVIGSAEFDIDDGDHFGFVWRMLPDMTFRGSTTESPQVTMTLIPMQNAGSGYNDPISLGGNPDATVTRTSTSVIEQFTGQVYVRVRGRQMILQVESNQLGCAWQLGSPRIDIKQDGRRGNS